MLQVRRMKGKVSGFPSALCTKGKEGWCRAHSIGLKVEASWLQGELIHLRGLRKGYGHILKGWRLRLHAFKVQQCTQVSSRGHRAHKGRLKGWYLGLHNVPMCSRRVHFFELQKCDQGILSHCLRAQFRTRGFVLLKCAQICGRVQGALLKNEGSLVKTLGCAHVILALMGSLLNQNLSKSRWLVKGWTRWVLYIKPRVTLTNSSG